MKGTTDRYGRALAPVTLDRDLLRAAGEHLGTLAERAHERYLLAPYTRHLRFSIEYDRFAKLDRLSREVLEIANG